MKIAILHLSDIHIRHATDPILARALKITEIAKCLAPTADAYILAATGDVAFSGTSEQYGLATAFFGQLKSLLSETGKPIFEFFIPGNHDLDLSSEPDTRPLLLESVREKIDAIDRNGETVRQIVSVQENFYRFEAPFLKSAPRPPNERLGYSLQFTVGQESVRVNCFNTAWVSTNPEKPGSLVFPIPQTDIEVGQGELVISAFHHPYNWFTPENGKLFRHHIERTSDVVMTGHEHESSSYVRQNSDMSTTHYVEGAVLQDSANGFSSFNVVIIDTAEGQYESYLCQWNDGSYDHKAQGNQLFVRNKLARKSAFQNNRSFVKVLSDPGLPILHPRKRDVALR